MCITFIYNNCKTCDQIHVYMVMNEKKFLIWSIILVYSLFGREILLKPELYNTDRYMYMYVGLTFAVYHS